MKNLMKGMLLLSVLVMMIIFATPVAAADGRNNDTIIIASGDVINDDLYLFGNRININGTVIGDVVCFGTYISVAGQVDGNLIAIGATIEIDGEVTHSARIAGNNVTISGNIGRDVIAAGDEIDLTDQAIIGRDLVFAGNLVHVDSLINDGILGVGSRIMLNNIIGDNVELSVDRLTIESTAVIQGDLVYTSEREAIIQNGARIVGTTTHILGSWPDFDLSEFALWGKLIAFFMTLVTGIVIVLFAPRRAKAVAESIRINPLRTLGWGALIFFVAPVALAILFITIIGIPLSTIGTVAYIIVIYLSQVAVGLFIGYWILGHFYRIESRGMLISAFVIGFTLLILISLIPFIGWVLWPVTAVFGIGAIVTSVKTLRSQKQEIV
jgi:cytoskeletal protein CcmA (bactofilin family)